MYEIKNIKFNRSSIEEVQRLSLLAQDIMWVGERFFRRNTSTKILKKFINLRTAIPKWSFKKLLTLVSNEEQLPRCACGKYENEGKTLCAKKPICQFAKDKLTQVRKDGFIDKHGVSNPMHLKSVRKKVAKTNLERYGVENNFQRVDIVQKGMMKKYGVSHNSKLTSTQDKRKENCLNKRGVEHPFQSEEVKDKMKETNLIRYGCEYPAQSEEVKDKMKATNLERYGVENNFQRIDSVQNGMMKKYGVAHPLQDPEIFKKFQKTAHSYKIVKLGKRKVRVQGYEKVALKFIVKVKNVPINFIKVSMDDDVPTIRYTFKGKDSVYYPDFLLGKKLLIEVKSTFTLYHNRQLFSKTKCKAKACLDQGYYFKLLLVQGTKVIELPKDWIHWKYNKIVSFVNELN